MTLNCGATFVKYLLCFFNFLLFALGGALLAVSIWIAIDNTSFFLLTRITDNINLQTYNETTVLETGAYILIAAGGIIFLLGFLGCCGAAMESRPLLVTYGLLLIVVFLLEVAAGVLIAIYKQEVETHLEDFLKMTLRRHYTHHMEPNSISVTWDAMMIQMQCCGVNNFTDFELANRWQRENESDNLVPRACCILQTEAQEVQEGVRAQGSGPLAYPLLDESCLYNPTENNSYYLIGCLRRLQAAAFYYMFPCISVAIGLGGLELIIITLSMYLCRAITVTRKLKYPLPFILSEPFYGTPSYISDTSSLLSNRNQFYSQYMVPETRPRTLGQQINEQYNIHQRQKKNSSIREQPSSSEANKQTSFSNAPTLTSNAVLKTNGEHPSIVVVKKHSKSKKRQAPRYFENVTANNDDQSSASPHTNFQPIESTSRPNTTTTHFIP